MRKKTLEGDFEIYPEHENLRRQFKAKNLREPDLNSHEWWEFCADNRKNKWVADYGNIPDSDPNIVCECGNENFKVCWWDYPHTGGYCRIICSECNQYLILINDYA